MILPPLAFPGFTFQGLTLASENAQKHQIKYWYIFRNQDKLRKWTMESFVSIYLHEQEITAKFPGYHSQGDCHRHLCTHLDGYSYNDEYAQTSKKDRLINGMYCLPCLSHQCCCWPQQKSHKYLLRCGTSSRCITKLEQSIFFRYLCEYDIL